MLLIVPTAAVPPGIPFTLQVTAVFLELLTAAVNSCVVPSRIEAEGGVRLTVTPEGGGGDGAEPTTPPQPRKDAANNSAGHQPNETFVKPRRLPYAVPRSMHRRIARAVPEWSMHRNAQNVEDTTHVPGRTIGR